MEVDCNYSHEVKTMGAESSNITLLTCIRRTQKQLGKHISRPPLLLKYLVQPPFLFIHDIITTIIGTKGLLRGLFTADELDRAQARSLKENRIKFLDKLIRALKGTTGERFPKFNLAKMSTGRHPLSVNRLLHSIAYALDMQMNSDLAVMKVNCELPTDLFDRGEKRKFNEDISDDDEYFGDDESESQQPGRKLYAKKKLANKKKSTSSIVAMAQEELESDENISLAYENDREIFNHSELHSLHDIQPIIVNTLSRLSLYDDSGSGNINME